MQSHKEPTTFEEFASRVFSPAPESASSSKPSTPAAERHGFTRSLVVSNDLSKSSIRNRSKSAVTKPTMEAEKLRLGKAYWVALTSVILSFLLVCLFVCLFSAPFSAPPVLCRFFLSSSLFPLSSIGFFSCFVYFACLFAVLSFVFFPALNSHPFCLFRLSYLGFVLSFSRSCLLSCCFSSFVFFACLISVFSFSFLLLSSITGRPGCGRVLTARWFGQSQYQRNGRRTDSAGQKKIVPEMEKQTRCIDLGGG